MIRTLLLVLILMGLGGGAYYYTQQQSKSLADPSTESSSAAAETVEGKTPKPTKTATLRLPEKTNNIWEMKPFELPDTQGNNRTLSEWKGKVIMLNFWASWCAPCQFEIPRFVRYQNTYADKGLQIVGIGLDDANKLKNVERSLEMNYPTMVIAQAEAGPLLEKFGNDQQIVPYTVVINKEGTIVYIHRGGLEDNDFKEFIEPLLL